MTPTDLISDLVKRDINRFLMLPFPEPLEDFDEGQKFNPYHDNLGKFASGGVGGEGKFVEYSHPNKDDLEGKLTRSSYDFPSKEENEAVNFYTSYGYKPMNDSLRGKSLRVGGDVGEEDIKYTPKAIADFDKVLATCTVNENVIVHRGISAKIANNLAGQPNGSLFQDKGYVSTSIYSKTARGHGTVVKIRVPKGSHGLFQFYGAAGGENELTLPRNGIFKLIGENTLEYMGTAE